MIDFQYFLFIILYHDYISRLVGFYSLSAIVGYLMPNTLYGYISNIYDPWTNFVDNISIEPNLIIFHIVKWFQTRIIVFTIDFLFEHS